MLIDEALDRLRAIRDELAPKDDEAMLVVSQAILDLKRLKIERGKRSQSRGEWLE